MFCPKCGQQNPEGAKFCARCGGNLAGQEAPAAVPKQPVTPPPTTPQTTSTGLSQNVAGTLCYLFGFISGIVFLLLEKENRFIRFHAMQSTITFGGLFVLRLALNFMPFLGLLRLFLTPLINLLSLILWVVLMIKAYQGERYKLPYIGDLTEKQIEKI